MSAAPSPAAPPAPAAEDALVAQVQGALPGLVSEVRRTGVRRVTARAPPERIRDAVSGLRALGCRHLSAMSA